MPEPLDLRAAFELEPADALAYFRGKGYAISLNWTDVWQQGHARAFTVAKIAKYSLLEDIRRSLDEALAKGETFESWKRRIVPILDEKGWWGTAKPEVTGTTEPVKVTPRRLKVIYDTNLRTARAAGQWKRIEEAAARRPYLRYSAVMDRRTRPEHRAWHNTVLRWDDPWWRTHFPPNGWFCRCNVQQLSERDLARYGYSISPAAPAGGTKLYTSKTGFTDRVPVGIDAGFAHNPGQAFWASIAPRLRDDPIIPPLVNPPRALPEVEPRVLPASELIEGLPSNARGDPNANATALAKWDEVVKPYLDPDESIIVDPTGAPIVIDQSVWVGSRGEVKITKGGRGRFLKLIARTMADPDEIWHEWVEDDPTNPKLQPGLKPSRLVRKMLGRYQIDGAEQLAIVILEIGNDGWTVTSAFDAYGDSQYQKRRSGTLAYRRT